MGVPGKSLGLLEGSLGLLGGSLEVLGGPWDAIGGAWGVPGRSLGFLGDPWGAIGSPRGCLWGSLGVLKWAYKNIEKPLFFLCFEHLEVLGRALEILLEPWELLWGALGGSEASLGAP